jgi:hypothetical protein
VVEGVVEGVVDVGDPVLEGVVVVPAGLPVLVFVPDGDVVHVVH